MWNVAASLKQIPREDGARMEREWYSKWEGKTNSSMLNLIKKRSASL